jgi:PAS domain S-box-containing protein
MEQAPHVPLARQACPDPMNRLSRQSSLRAQIILLSLAASMFAWVMSAFLDFYLHYWDRTFPEVLLFNVPPREIYSRVAISIAFIIAGATASRMVRRLDQVEQRTHRLNLSLRAIRSVNQLITRERDLDEVTRGVCKRLVEHRGYFEAAVFLRGRLSIEVAHSREPGDSTMQRTTIDVPLRCGDEVHGELAVTLPADLAGDAEEREFLGEVADDLAFAIRSLRLEEERERRAAAQRALYQVSSGLSSASSPSDLQPVVQYGLSGVLGTSCVKITYYDPDTDQITLPGSHLGGEDGRDSVAPAAGTLAGCVARTGIVLLVDRPQIERMCEEHVIGFDGHPPAVWAGVPITVAGRIEAILSAEHPSDPQCLGRDEVELLQFVAEQLGTSTERQRADRRIREQREELQTILDSVPAYIFYKDADCRYLRVNRALAEMTGIPGEEWVGKRIDEVLPGLGEGASWRDAEVIRTGEARIDDVEMIEINGEMCWLETDRIATRDPSGRTVGVIGLSIDVTDRRKAEAALVVKEEELRRSQKMEAVGLLAGGIAHDFNNLLTAISGYAELSLSSLPDDDPVVRNLRGIHEAAGRAASLTHQLLAFGRRQPLQLMASDVSVIAKGTRTLLERLIGEDIELVMDLGQDLPTVCVDPGQIGQVIINLAVNARDAMPEGGKLTIGAERVAFGEAQAASSPHARPGTFAKLTVADTGIGMTDEIMKHIFEPFFTTKGQWCGTGLGLSVVYGIVEQHGGWIDVDSVPGKGSTFSVFVPEGTERPQEQQPREPSVASVGAGEGQQILLVEDEELIRRLAATALRKNGYAVVEAATAEDALRVLEDDDSFALIFSDVVLPGMNGVKLADAVLARRPESRVLLCSGYADEKSQWRLIRDRKLPFLDKPYTIQHLLEAVHGALCESPSDSFELEGEADCRPPTSC